jgi:hypothetical protein
MPEFNHSRDHGLTRRPVHRDMTAQGSSRFFGVDDWATCRTGDDMKKIATPLIVVGGGLVAFGIFESHSGPYGWAGWSIGDQIAIAIGVALAIWGSIIRKDSRGI